MARHNGPVKGSIVIINNDGEAAESTLVIVEPYIVNTATYTAITSGTMTLTGKVTKDELGHPYIDFANNAAASTATASRRNGVTKGQICVVCEETASSTLFLVEPVLVNDAAKYALIVAGDVAAPSIHLGLFADTATATMYCGAGTYTPS